jgi:hypothetical protein
LSEVRTILSLRQKACRRARRRQLRVPVTRWSSFENRRMRALLGVDESSPETSYRARYAGKRVRFNNRPGRSRVRRIALGS